MEILEKKLIYGVGFNDADYAVRPTIKGMEIRCPYHTKWSSMIERCYSKKAINRRPTYRDCSVAEDWLSFSNFKDWMLKQDWQDKVLDKDILVQGNKVYSADTCIFVHHSVNSLFTKGNATRGSYPIGVTWHKRDKKFHAQCNVNGKLTSLGLHKTADQAHEVYKKFKYALIKEVALKQTEPLRSAMLAYKIERY